MSRTIRSIIEALVIATVLTVALSLITHFYAHQTINWFETVAVWLSFGSTWLCTRQVRFNYVFGIGATALLSYVFWTSGLYGSMALNLYLVPTVVYGFFAWGRDTNTKPVEHVKVRSLWMYIGTTGLTWLGAYLTINALGGNMGVLDGWLLVGSILAQYLMDRKKIENWIVWGLVNIVSVYVYINSGLYLLAAQFVLFFANAVYAWFQWRKTMKQNEVTEDEGTDILPVEKPVLGLAQPATQTSVL